MRLDRFLARWFSDRSRTWIAKGIDLGLVRLGDDRPLRPSYKIRTGDALRLYLPEIAPSEPPPPFPPILHEDHCTIAVDKPAGMMAHPSGARFVWGLISLAKLQWPDQRVDLAHRLDRDTSGVLLLTKGLSAQRILREAFDSRACIKEYEAICKGDIPWDAATLDGPIGPANGPIRVQMAVRDGGLTARTDVRVIGRANGLTRVRIRLFTGRTHQIRVHLAHAGFPLLGDRLYGTDPDVFLAIQERGVTEETLVAAGAPRQALHAARLVVPHPDGGELDLATPVPDDMERWWADPGVLPLDGRPAPTGDGPRPELKQFDPDDF